MENIKNEGCKCIPPVEWDRNEFGLLTNINYEFKEDGTIDWLKMIPKEFLVPNREKTSETNIDLLDNSKLLVLLDGFKKVAKLRGFTEVKSTSFGDPNFVSVTTSITWIPNYQDRQPVTSIGMADATLMNTASFAKDFLTTIAENRSFVRAVRNFLEIPVLGKDELGSSMSSVGNSKDEESSSKPSSALESLLAANGIKFESFKNQMIKSKIEGAENWNELSDVPSGQIFDLIGIVQKLLKIKKERLAAKTE